MKKDLFDWYFSRNQKFELKDVQELLEKIKSFNAGAIDEYLSKHVDQVYQEWLKDRRSK